MIPCSPPNHTPLFQSLDAKQLDAILSAQATKQNTSGILENPMLLFCQTGEITLSIDQKEFTVTPSTVCTLYPYSYIKITHYSSDYTGFYFEIPLTTYRRVHGIIGTPLTSQLRTNPCFDVTPPFAERINLYRKLYANYAQNPLSPGSQDAIFYLTMSIVHEVKNLYDNRIKTAGDARPTRQDSIFYQFLVLVSQHYLTHRDVDYYAGEMAITPRHLTRVVKEKTGRSCSQWIKEIAIVHIKRMLLENNNQVQDVSYALNFPNPSFFAQYFKKETGLTPREYQRKYEQL